ncbi:monooxygenase [Deinococcus yavapaiensis]|uniref:Copper type II ascorbate-dependent monooxygenase-like protein n=1 Tax=Deinococcus yavapaiensis KR-236 TaxID=694435 RepID=A0A318SHH7_9DEIO|nr:monooxygenase [Deinococcus yavapaiensis]PYE56595.1 copper type II ascorbate-dependent monooxygenase-like protein [Deinococcus yavapaiensis KR-236]
MKKAILAAVAATAALGVGIVLAQGGSSTPPASHDSHGMNTPESTKTLPMVLPSSTPTYHGDVRPILEANCAGCHMPGGIAPFSLRDADLAKRMAPDIAAAVSSGHMPPWMPGPDSPPLQNERRLTPRQIGTLVAWAKAGAPLGDPAKAAAVPKPNVVAVRADMTLTMPKAYAPDEKLTDDYRCFVLDPGLKKDRFVTGYDILPNVGAQVHHVILYQVSADVREEALAKNGQDGRDGWTCFGGPEVGGTAGLAGVIGTWTPGTVPTVFPNGTGVLMPAGGLVVMQVHYNLAAGDKPDRSAVKLQLAPEGAALDRLRLFVLAGPVEIPCDATDKSAACTRREALRAAVRKGGQGALNLSQGLLVSCGANAEDLAKQPANNVTSSCDRTVSVNREALGAILHMHTRGKAIKLILNPGKPTEKVLLDIPAWDFHWQGNYFYKTPVKLQVGDTVRLTCTWDNTRVQPQRYVIWGEGTEDEMCLGALTVR